MRPMARAAALLAVTAACSFACSMQKIERPSPDAAPQSKGMTQEQPLPDAPPIREPYTVLRAVKVVRTDEKGALFEATVGHTVTYEPLPPFEHDLERRWPAGTVIVEDASCRMIGVITPHGMGFRYDSGREVEVGRGTVEYLLPAFFGEGRTLIHRRLAG